MGFERLQPSNLSEAWVLVSPEAGAGQERAVQPKQGCIIAFALDGQTDSQPVIRGSCLSGGGRFGAAVLSLRPVNPEDLQSRLMSEQIAD